ASDVHGGRRPGRRPLRGALRAAGGFLHRRGGGRAIGARGRGGARLCAQAGAPRENGAVQLVQLLRLLGFAMSQTKAEPEGREEGTKNTKRPSMNGPVPLDTSKIAFKVFLRVLCAFFVSFVFSFGVA